MSAADAAGAAANVRGECDDTAARADDECTQRLAAEARARQLQDEVRRLRQEVHMLRAAGLKAPASEFQTPPRRGRHPQAAAVTGASQASTAEGSLASSRSPVSPPSFAEPLSQDAAPTEGWSSRDGDAPQRPDNAPGCRRSLLDLVGGCVDTEPTEKVREPRQAAPPAPAATRQETRQAEREPGPEVSSNSSDNDSANGNDSANNNNNDHEISNIVIGNAPNVWAGIVLDKVDSYYWSSPDDWLLKACVADDAQNKGLYYTMGRWPEDKLAKALDSDKASVRKIAAETLLVTKTVISKDTRDRVLHYFSEDGQDGDFTFSMENLEDAFKMCTHNDLSFEERHEALTNFRWTLRGLADREEIKNPMDRELYADEEGVVDREMYDKAGSQEFLADDLPEYMGRVEACLVLLANDGVSLSGSLNLLAWSQGAERP